MLITQKIKASNIGLPTWAKQVLKDRGLKENEIEVLRKGISPEDTKVNKKERSTVDYITTKVVDRDGDIVVPKGAVLDHYRKHPVVLFAHNYSELPVGKSLWIKADEKGLISKTQYAKHQKAEEIYQYRKDGFPMAKSIGFIPLSMVEEKDFDQLDLKALDLNEEDLKGAARVYPEWLMLEYSDVPVPSNPEALQLAISKGIITVDEAKIAAENSAFVLEIKEEKEEKLNEEGAIEDNVVLKPETTENYHRIPINDKSDFVQDSFRTITISSKKGIKAIIGKLKSDPNGPTKVHTYLFDVNKFTMEEAQAWVDSHKDQDPKEEKEMLQERYGKDAVLYIFDEADPIPDGDGDLISSDEDDKPTIVKSRFDKFKSVEGVSQRWNLSLSKEFDVENVDVPPSTVLYDIASKWLECKIRDMYVYEKAIPSSMLGNFLSGLEDSLKGYEHVISRNFMANGSESPLVFDVIQLTSKSSQDFLISGMSFYKKDGKRVIISRRPGWYGLEITAYSTNQDSQATYKIFSDTNKWIEENNLLKGESFALSGEFLERTDVDWDSLFLTPKNEKAVKNTVDLINRKGVSLTNRGIILIGPPGTGKTLSGRIINNKADATFIWVSARDFIYSGSVGGISHGFNMARKLAPSILFIEDIDNWLGARSTDLMKTEMDGIAQSKGVVTILTSNYPEMLPPALIDRPGRFHDILNFSLPDASTRMRMLKNWASDAQEKTISHMVQSTAGFSGAHMFELVAFAKGIAEDEEIDIDNALLLSLNKIKEQRELIDDIKKGVLIIQDEPVEELLPIDEESELVELSEELTEPVEKAGKVLSKKTRSIISDATSSMGKAIEALDELIKNADSREESDTPHEESETPPDGEKDVVMNIVEKTPEMINIQEIDETRLKSTITEALYEILRNQKRVDVGDIVKERLDIRKGKIF